MVHSSAQTKLIRRLKELFFIDKKGILVFYPVEKRGNRDPSVSINEAEVSETLRSGVHEIQHAYSDPSFALLNSGAIKERTGGRTVLVLEKS